MPLHGALLVCVEGGRKKSSRGRSNGGGFAKESFINRVSFLQREKIEIERRGVVKLADTSRDLKHINFAGSFDAFAGKNDERGSRAQPF